MGHYDRKILNALIDSYENSLLSRGENKVAIHVSFGFNKRNLPEYFNESSLEYESIHTHMKELEERKFLTIVWKNGKKDHIIQKVILNENTVSDVYSYLKRVPKNVNERNTLKLLEESKKKYNSPIASRVVEYLVQRIKEGKSVKEYIDLADFNRTEMLIKAIASIENNKKSCYIREFSIQCFGDSKKFDEMLSKIYKVWRNFGSQENKQEDIYTILAEHSIYNTPNYVYFKGTGILVLDQQKIDLEIFHQGIGISGEDLQNTYLLRKENTQKVITIENLTTFFRIQEKDSLIIYLGGYHNSLRRELLKKIYIQLPEAEYLHFGDIDVGGFLIFEDLCQKTKIPFHTYHMRVDELKKYHNYTKELTANDEKRLTMLIQKKNHEECEYMDVLDYMKKNKVKLEQECIRDELH